MKCEENTCLLGIDIGTTSWKMAAYDPLGQPISFWTTPCRMQQDGEGHATHDPSELWNAVCAGIRKVTGDVGLGNIVSVAVASVGESGVLLDRNDRPLYPVIAWFDQRTLEQAQWWADEVGKQWIYQITGYPLQYIPSINKIMWIRKHEPDAFTAAVKWLCVADYIAYRLCGEMAMDYSLASRTMALDIRARAWSNDMLNIAGIPPSLFPSVVPSGTRLGTVSKAASRETGLTRDCVVTAGGHDHICAALAVGATHSGKVLDSAGTAEVLLIPLEKPQVSLDLLESGLATGCHCAPGKFYLMGVLQTAGASLDWVRELLGIDHSSLEAGSKGTGLFFLPHLRGSVSPYVDSGSRAAFVGLRAHHSKNDLMRSVVEGVCYEARLMMDNVKAFTGVDPTRVVFVGGGTKNPLWLRTKCDVMGKPLEAYLDDETVTRGAAMLAGLGASLFPNLDTAIRHMGSRAIEHIPSEGMHEYHKRNYEVYSSLYGNLKEVNEAISARFGQIWP